MANFWDLPRPVRDQICRFTLVENEPISTEKNRQLAKHTTPNRRFTHHGIRRMPTICAVSSKTDREAGQIYYGENDFLFGELKRSANSNIYEFMTSTWPRHYRKIRKVIFHWPKPNHFLGGGAREAFLEIGKMTGLQEFQIGVDEKKMVRDMLWYRRSRRPQFRSTTSFSPQDNLAILRHPGMTGLLTLHDIAHVEFVKRIDWNGSEEGGPISGGVLETEIAPKLMGPKRLSLRQGDGAFSFFALPPELRNRIYAMLLHVEGPLEPSPRLPSSAPKKCSASSHLTPPGSALNLLAVCRRFHDEAVGIFYHANQFLHRNPAQLAGFVTTLSQIRAQSLRDVTLHYESSKVGGIELATIALPVLKQLTGLRRLHILFPGTFFRRVRHLRIWNPTLYHVDDCNPVSQAGMRTLFELRGVENIQAIDTELEDEIDKLRKKDQYPDGFAADSGERIYIKLHQIMAHFNSALAAAQIGKLNREILLDPSWHTKDQFPPAETVPEEPSASDTAEDETASSGSSAETENAVAAAARCEASGFDKEPAEDDFNDGVSGGGEMSTGAGSDAELPREDGANDETESASASARAVERGGNATTLLEQGNGATADTIPNAANDGGSDGIEVSTKRVLRSSTRAQKRNDVAPHPVQSRVTGSDQLPSSLDGTDDDTHDLIVIDSPRQSGRHRGSSTSQQDVQGRVTRSGKLLRVLDGAEDEDAGSHKNESKEEDEIIVAMEPGTFGVRRGGVFAQDQVHQTENDAETFEEGGSYWAREPSVEL